MKSFVSIKLICVFAILFAACQTLKQSAPSAIASNRPDSIQQYPMNPLSKKVQLELSGLGPFYFPIHGKVISHFGYRGNEFHSGTDIKLNHGDKVRAGFNGTVTLAANYHGYGNLVILNHGNQIETYYAHLSKIIVHAGDSVTKGTVVGLGGRTGLATTDHLHFEIRVNHKPYNPELFFDFNNVKVIASRDDRTIGKIVNKPAQQPERSNTARKIHVVEKDDTLYSLAKRYGTTVKYLCDINGIKPASILKIGEKLKISN